MIVPIFLPRRSRPYVAPKCPHCHNELYGWEPPASHWYDHWYVIASMMLVGVFFVIIGITVVIEWLDPWCGVGVSECHPTLWQVIKDNWNWLFSHKLW